MSAEVVVVTGAAGDLGQAVVAALVKRGATVVAAGRDAERLAKVLPAGVAIRPIDLSDEASTLAWGHELVSDFGRVDGLFHLVGGWRGGAGIAEVDLSDWDVLHDSLIRTLQHATKALHDPIRASRDGRIAIVSSNVVAKPTATNAVYATAKAAAEAWMLAVADSFKDSDAAATIVRIKALVTDEMRAAKPNAKFAGFSDVAPLAEQLVGLFDQPAEQINGAVLSG